MIQVEEMLAARVALNSHSRALRAMLAEKEPLSPDLLRTMRPLLREVSQYGKFGGACADFR